MKTIIKIFTVLFLAGTVNFAYGHDEYTRVIKKEFSVNADAQLTIDNSFGKVHCNNWDKNIVQIEVTITVEAANENSAGKLFDKISIIINGSASQIDAKTIMTKQ